MFRRKNTSKNAGGKGRNNRTTKNNRNNRSGSIPNSRPNNNRSGSIPSSRPKNNFSKIPRPRNTLTPYRTEYARNQPTIYSNLPSDPSQALNVLKLRNTPNPEKFYTNFTPPSSNHPEYRQNPYQKSRSFANRMEANNENQKQYQISINNPPSSLRPSSLNALYEPPYQPPYQPTHGAYIVPGTRPNSMFSDNELIKLKKSRNNFNQYLRNQKKMRNPYEPIN